MVDKNISLTDLERQLSRRLEEVQNLQRELEQKKAEFQDLKSLRELLEKQLQEVDAKIAGIGTSTKVGIETKPVATPVATRTVVAPDKPKAAPTTIRTKRQPKIPSALEKSPESLSATIVRVLKASSKPLLGKEIADRVLKAGYTTESANFMNVVWLALAKLKEKKVIIHVADGYRLKKK